MSKIRKKIYVVLALTLALGISLPAGAYAMLHADVGSKVNEFAGAYINAAVIENGKTHENATNNEEAYRALKKNNDRVEKIVSVKNIASGDHATSMFTRVRLIPSIVKDDNSSVLGGSVKVTYTFSTNTKWKMQGETFYYTEKIKPEMESEVLLESVSLNQDIPDGYHLELKVISDSIATRPDTVLKSAWNLEKGFEGMENVPSTITIY